MQRGAFEARAATGNPPGCGLAVVGIHDQRVAGMGEVNADLVGPARCGEGLHERGPIPEGDDGADEGRRRPPAGHALPGAHPPLPTRAHRDVDAELAGHRAPDEGQVALRDLVPLEERAEAAVGVGTAREDEDAAGPPVEPVDHPERPEQVLRLLPDGPLRHPTARDDDAPRRLVHGGKMLVGEEDLKAHITCRTGQTSTGPKRASCLSRGPAGPTARTTPSSTGRWRAVAACASPGVIERMRSW